MLRDKRSLLDVPYGREDTPYVTESIRDIREQLTKTLTELGPDAGARSSHDLPTARELVEEIDRADQAAGRR